MLGNHWTPRAARPVVYPKP